MTRHFYDMLTIYVNNRVNKRNFPRYKLIVVPILCRAHNRLHLTSTPLSRVHLIRAVVHLVFTILTLVHHVLIILSMLHNNLTSSFYYMRIRREQTGDRLWALRIIKNMMKVFGFACTVRALLALVGSLLALFNGFLALSFSLLALKRICLQVETFEPHNSAKTRGVPTLNTSKKSSPPWKTLKRHI